jgi:hypothetical protein
MPSYKQTTMIFISDFLMGNKEQLKSADIQHYNVPLYSELAVKHIF